MNNEYDSGLYGTNLKYFKNITDFNEYIADDSKEKALPNVAMISDELGEDGVVMTPESNPTVWSILSDAGLIEDGKTSLTADDCAAFSDDDLYNRHYGYDANEQGVCEQTGNLREQTNGDSIFTYYNTYSVDFEDAVKQQVNRWTFNEFKYFTGITEVSPGFFSFCRGLTEISIPSSVTSIGQSAFNNCIYLEKCIIYNTPENVQIYITEDQHSIEAAETKGVDLIYANYSAFAYAGAYSSKGNTVIKWVDPSEGLFTIVYNWQNEESVITASSNPDVYNILTAANYRHTGPNEGYTEADLAAITDTDITVSHYEQQSLQNNNMSIFSFYGNEKDNYDSSTYDVVNSCAYHGPDNPNYVESWTFNEFKYFTGLTELPENCFRNCTTLTEITLPDTITYVGNEAFHDCWNIEKFDTQGRIDDISWNDNAINYMSRHIVGDSYWDDYYGNTVDAHLKYLGSHGVDIS